MTAYPESTKKHQKPPKIRLNQTLRALNVCTTARRTSIAQRIHIETHTKLGLVFCTFCSGVFSLLVLLGPSYDAHQCCSCMHLAICWARVQATHLLRLEECRHYNSWMNCFCRRNISAIEAVTKNVCDSQSESVSLLIYFHEDVVIPFLFRFMIALNHQWIY